MLGGKNSKELHKQLAYIAELHEWHQTPVPNDINVLQACICKSVKTGLFLKSIEAARVNKYNMLMLFFTLKYQVL